MAGRFSVETVFKSIDRVTRPVRRMQKNIRRFTASVTRGLKSVKKATGSVLTGLKRGGLVLGGVLALAATATNRLAAEADALAKQSRRLDFPIEELQEWVFVASQSGVNTELFNSSMGAFSKRLGEARGGIGPLVSGLKKINPQLLKQLQNTNSISEALELYLDAIRATPRAVDKAALANAAFSRSGLKLVDIAVNSKSAIQRLREEQRRNGVVTMAQAQAAEAYNDAVDSLQRTIKGFMQETLLPLLPMLKDGVRATQEWILANKGLVSGRVRGFIQGISDDVGGFLDKVMFVGKAIAYFVAFTAVLNTFIGVMTAVNLVMALNPIGLIVLGVVALIAAFAALIIYIDDINEHFDAMPGIFKLALAPLQLLVKTIQFIKNNAGAVLDLAARAGAFLGLTSSDEEDDAAGGSDPTAGAVASPQGRTAMQINENSTISSAELTIRDETGRADLSSTQPAPGILLNLPKSGAF